MTKTTIKSSYTLTYFYYMSTYWLTISIINWYLLFVFLLQNILNNVHILIFFSQNNQILVSDIHLCSEFCIAITIVDHKFIHHSYRKPRIQFGNCPLFLVNYFQSRTTTFMEKQLKLFFPDSRSNICNSLLILLPFNFFQLNQFINIFKKR